MSDAVSQGSTGASSPAGAPPAAGSGGVEAQVAIPAGGTGHYDPSDYAGRFERLEQRAGDAVVDEGQATNNDDVVDETIDETADADVVDETVDGTGAEQQTEETAQQGEQPKPSLADELGIPQGPKQLRDQLATVISEKRAVDAIVTEAGGEFVVKNGSELWRSAMDPAVGGIDFARKLKSVNPTKFDAMVLDLASVPGIADILTSKIFGDGQTVAAVRAAIAGDVDDVDVDVDPEKADLRRQLAEFKSADANAKKKARHDASTTRGKETLASLEQNLAKTLEGVSWGPYDSLKDALFEGAQNLCLKDPTVKGRLDNLLVHAFDDNEFGQQTERPYVEQALATRLGGFIETVDQLVEKARKWDAHERSQLQSTKRVGGGASDVAPPSQPANTQQQQQQGQNSQSRSGEDYDPEDYSGRYQRRFGTR